MPASALSVVHVNTYARQGGAARAAYRLHESLRDTGACRSAMYALHVREPEEHIHRYQPVRAWPLRIERRWRAWRIERDFARYAATRPEGLEPFSDDRTRYGAQVVRQLPPHVIFSLHCMTGSGRTKARSDSGTTAPTWHRSST
jgi:hypothetical protein